MRIDGKAGVGPGFRPPALIERSVAGHQPMPSSDERYIVNLDGEICDHGALLVTLRT